jgi:peroxiredoxin
MPGTGSKRRRRVRIAVGALIVAAAATVFLMMARREQVGLSEGDLLPRFTLRDYRGRLHASSDLWGKVVAVIFWKVSVEASVAELKGLDELRKTYGDRGLEVLGIALDSNEGAFVRNFAQKHRVKVPLLIGDVETAHRFGGLRGVPTLFLFDREGRMREMLEGFRANEILEEKILGLL